MHNDGKAEGLAEGVVISRIEGEQEKAREIAWVLLQKGLAIDLISESIGLSVKVPAYQWSKLPGCSSYYSSKPDPISSTAYGSCLQQQCTAAARYRTFGSAQQAFCVQQQVTAADTSA